MNIIAFSYFLDGLMSGDIEKILQQSGHIEFISSDEKILKYKINLKTRLPKSLEDLREAEARLNTGDTHDKRAFSNIMSAANAEISAIEDPLLMTIEDNMLTIQKSTILDPESTEFEMMFFYLQNHLIEFFRELLGEYFDLDKLKVEIKTEGSEDK
jgi:esterase/lipase